MPDRHGPWEASELLDRVRLTEEPALGSEIAGRLPSPSEPRAVSVSDLLAPRRAFWRRLRGPAPLPLEREVKLEQGRAWHRRLGDAIAGDGTLEVRVRRGGLAARIDLLSDVPVEIKTGAPAPDGSEPDDWPDQVEQLGIYCALVGSPVGRLAHLALHDARPPTVTVGELKFRGLGDVTSEVERRRAELRAAITSGTAERLARCPWFDRGCEYRAAGLCDCRGDERTGASVIVGHLDQRTSRPEIAARWTEALRSAAERPARSPGHFRDLLHPRRAYFDRTRGRPHVPAPSRPASAPLDPYERTVAALEAGPVGEVHRLAGGPDAPEEEVLAWRGAPCLVRAPRVRSRLTADEVRGRFPQYLIDLGFRCAVTGVDHATLVVGYEAPGREELPAQAFRIELPGGIEPFVSGWRARSAALETAVARETPNELPACPAWMATDCPYRDVCGCGGGPPRSQR
jgi:hypothetical protein